MPLNPTKLVQRLRTVRGRCYRRWSVFLNRPHKAGRKDHLGIGVLGERIAGAFLRCEGYKILYRNFRSPRGGEIDLVARDGEVLCFVEVKTRTSSEFGRPLEAVDRRKQQRIERAADEWLRLLGTREIPWRFDVVEIVLIEGRETAGLPRA